MTAVVRWDRDTLAERRDELLDVYAEAMQVPTAAARNRRQIVSAHLERAGLCVAAAVEDDELLGIGYGYRGAPGQWWHDQVRDVLSIEAARTWLDGSFEVVRAARAPGRSERVAWGVRCSTTCSIRPTPPRRS